jgi:transcriptional regulator with XRE-family HTH domain
VLVILSKTLYGEHVESASLGTFLRAARKASGFTLRRVEELSQGRVKNGYLSQVESGVIRVPSTKVLHELAGIYGVEYDQLLSLAGLPVTGAVAAREEARIASFPVSALADLTDAETQDVLDFIAFMKSKRSN